VTTSEINPGIKPKDFLDLVKNRRSVRAYRDESLNEEMLQTILEVMMNAPSAGNLQAYKVVIVRDEARKKALVEAAHDQAFIAQAPVVLVFFAHPEESAVKYNQRGAELYSVQDATVACSYAQLAAATLGLGTVWVGSFDDAAVSRALNANPEWRPVAMLPTGFPAETPTASPRRSLGEVVRNNHH